MTTRRPAPFWVALLALITLLGVGAWSALQARPAPRAERPNVLVLLVDTLRADHLGLYGYPRPTSPQLDRFARDAFVFRNAHSVAAWTKPAVASLLTGLTTPRHRVLDFHARLPRSVPTLATWFREAGYHTLYVSGGNEHVTPAFGISEAFEEFLMTRQGYLAAGVNRAFWKRVDAWRGEPFLAVLHYMDVHLPYYPNPDRERFTMGLSAPFSQGPPEDLEAATLYNAMRAGGLSPSDRAHLEALYDGQIRHVDAEIGRLLAKLRETGLARRTLVVVLSDHGEEFWEHGAYEHGHTLYSEVLRIPLLVRGPGVRAGASNALISIADVAPTLLELAGLAVPRALEGLSAGKLLRSGAPYARDPFVLLGTLYGPERYGLMTERHKLLVNTTGMEGKLEARLPASGPSTELYDYPNDPAEHRDLSPHDPALIEQLRARLAPLLERSPMYAPEQVDLSQDQRDRLRSLGYGE